MIETGKIINGDCIEVMKTFPEGSIDLLVTSPPYGVNIKYDVYNDSISDFEKYFLIILMVWSALFHWLIWFATYLAQFNVQHQEHEACIIVAFLNY